MANLNQKRSLTAQLDGQEFISHHQYLILLRFKKTLSVCVFSSRLPPTLCAHIGLPTDTHINTYTQQSFRNCHLFLTLFCMCDRKCSFQLFKISHSSKPPSLLLFWLSPFYLTPSFFQVVENNASFFIYLLLFLLLSVLFIFTEIQREGVMG